MLFGILIYDGLKQSISQLSAYCRWRAASGRKSQFARSRPAPGSLCSPMACGCVPTTITSDVPPTRSHHRRTSRCAGGTKSDPACRVTRATNSVIACLVASPFHDVSGSVCACAWFKAGSAGPNKIDIAAAVFRRTRRLMPEDIGFTAPCALPLVQSHEPPKFQIANW